VASKAGFLAAMTKSGELEAHYGLLLGLVPPWKVEEVNLDLSDQRVEIEVTYPGGYKVKCPEPECAKECRIKDHRAERTWRHLDTMQFETLVKCRVPRAECPEHGVKTIQVPWAGPRSRFTLLFERFAIEVLRGARSISKAQELLRLSWDQIHRIQKMAVERGLARRDLDEIDAVGIDEKSFTRGHNYVSLMSDLERGRVLEVVQGRDFSSTFRLWETLPEEQRKGLSAVAMDMWEPYMTAAAVQAPNASIVHDKFHVAKYLGKAVDDVRKKEHRQLRREGSDALKGTKYLWLRNPGDWSREQRRAFRDLKREGLKVGRAWAIKEAFSKFWEYRYPASARKFFKNWYYWATHSRLKPVIATAKTLKRHLPGLISYITHRVTNAVTEGLNSKIQSIKANARGFRNFEHYRISILFHCGKLQLYP
jgi:transposase